MGYATTDRFQLEYTATFITADQSRIYLEPDFPGLTYGVETPAISGIRLREPGAECSIAPSGKETAKGREERFLVHVGFLKRY